MPELPEVEVIRRGLEKYILGKTIQKIEILGSKTFQGDPKNVEGESVVAVWRRAKMLGLELGEITLLFHLKMTGQLVYISDKRFVGGHPTEDMKGKMPSNSTRVIFTFGDNSKLYFNDQRRFGWVRVVKSEKCKVQSEGILGRLGPEPFDKNFTWQILKSNLLNHKSQPIKVAIMDQSVVSGVGNIYSSESLFLAKIDPRRKVSELSDQEFKSLHRGVIKSLRDGIKHGGSTRAHFVNVEGERGYFLDYANVYGKEGYKCNNCPGKVQKIQLGGRGTYFCSSCQK